MKDIYGEHILKVARRDRPLDIRDHFSLHYQSVAVSFAGCLGNVEAVEDVAREPLSLDDMAEKPEVSKASVSTNIRISGSAGTRGADIALTGQRTLIRVSALAVT